MSWETPAGGAGSAGWTNVGLDWDGTNFLVGDFTNGRAVRVTKAGAYVSEVTGLAAGNVLQAVRLAPDASGDIWVTRYATPNGTIRRFNSAGVLQQTISPTPGVNGPNAGIFFDLTAGANGRIYTTWEDGNVRGYNLSTGALEETITVTGVPGGSSTGLLDGLVEDFADPLNFFWVTVDAKPGASLCKINRSTGAAASTLIIPVSPEGISWGDGDGSQIWVCFDQGFHNGYTNGNRVYRLDVATGNDLDLSVLGECVGSFVSGSGATSYNATNNTPSANRLQLLWVFNSRTTTPASVPTASGCGITWDQVGTFLESGQQRRITLFRGTNASPTAGTITISFGGVSQTGCHVDLVELWASGLNLASNGAAVIVPNTGSITSNTGTEQAGTSTGVTVTLATLSNPANSVSSFVRNNTTGSITAGTNYLGLGLNTGTAAHLSGLGRPGSTTPNFTWGFQSVTTRAAAVEIQSPFGAKALALMGVG
jgi:hypothetical protein